MCHYEIRDLTAEYVCHDVVTELLLQLLIGDNIVPATANMQMMVELIYLPVSFGLSAEYLFYVRIFHPNVHEATTTPVSLLHI